MKLSPGQFFTIAVDAEPRQVVRLPLSFASVDVDAGTIETAYALIGPGTMALSKMREGSATSVLGPCGNGWELSPTTKHCLLVAGGIGITPLLSAACSLALEGIPYDCIIGTRTAGMIWGTDTLVAHGCKNLILTTDDGSTERQGTAVAAFRDVLKTDTYDSLLTCGPPAMLKTIAEIAQEANISCQVSLERNMTCGFGACSTCAVKTKQGNKSCCLDGPIFNAEEVVW